MSHSRSPSALVVQSLILLHLIGAFVGLGNDRTSRKLVFEKKVAQHGSNWVIAGCVQKIFEKKRDQK
jgi:hypothetical protein